MDYCDERTFIITYFDDHRNKFILRIIWKMVGRMVLGSIFLVEQAYYIVDHHHHPPNMILRTLL